MKYQITESQQSMINEVFNPLNYLTFLFKREKKENFEKYVWRNAFQEVADQIFKFTIREVPVKGLKSIKVIGVKKYAWGQDFNKPNDKGQRYEWVIKVEPIVDRNEVTNLEEFMKEFINFEKTFPTVQKYLGYSDISPIQDKDVLNHTIKFIFGLNSLDYLNTKKIETNESEITEKCWKGYVQKGMKTMFGKRYPNCIKKKKK